MKKDKIFRDYWRMLQAKRNQHIDLENKLDELKMKQYQAKQSSDVYDLIPQMNSLVKQNDFGEESLSGKWF